MNARHKLNQAYLLGNVMLAAIAGVLCGSWTVFVVVVVLLVVLSMHAGEIRPFGKKSRSG
jgi:hypothetical protein